MNMKKIFTLIICVVALCPMAKADNNALIDRCINFILGAGNPNTTIMAANLDVNNDGVVNITDVTNLVNSELQNSNQPRPMRVRAKKSSVDELIQQTLKSKESSPNIQDVIKAISEENNKE